MKSDILKQILNQKKEEALKTIVVNKPIDEAKKEEKPEAQVTESITLDEADAKIVGYSKSHPELADALAQLIKGFLAKTNVNTTALVAQVVKDTGVNKAQLISAAQELGLTELTESSNKNVTVDIDHTGEVDLNAKKYHITIKSTGKTMANASGTKENLAKYLTAHYDSKEDAAELHPEVFE